MFITITLTDDTQVTVPLPACAFKKRNTFTEELDCYFNQHVFETKMTLAELQRIIYQLSAPPPGMPPNIFKK